MIVDYSLIVLLQIYCWVCWWNTCSLL